MTRLTGTLTFWNDQQHYGFIRIDQGQTYYAHLREFKSPCKCGHKHMCEVTEGIQVEFTPGCLEEGSKKFAKPALAIEFVEVKE